jgi:hypothetical protein
MTDKMIDVHALAELINGNYQIKVINSQPRNIDNLVKVLEAIDGTRQLVLWVPRGTPGDMAQNLATHLVPDLRNSTSVK